MKHAVAQVTALTADADWQAILEDHRRRQLAEHLAGPAISLLLHAVLIVGGVVILMQANPMVTIEDPLIGVTLAPPSAFHPEEPVTPMDPGLDGASAFGPPVPAVVPAQLPPVDAVAAPGVSAPGGDPEGFLAALPDPGFALPIPAYGPPGAGFGPGVIPPPMRVRTPDGRKKAIADNGGSPAGERAVLLALEWLRQHQEPDGSWSPRQHTAAMTGLAMLTFLGHGETQTSPAYGATVLKGLGWLANATLAAEAPADQGYGHGIMTYALAEGFALPRLPILRPPMDKALGMIIAGQQTGGGFDYNYAKGERWDLSVTAWQLQALKAGMLAGSRAPGLEEAIARGVHFVSEIAYRDGRFGYSAPGSGSWAMQGAGTLCLELLGHWDSREAVAGVKNIAASFQPAWDDQGEFQASSHPSYVWYYCTQAVFHGGERVFRAWNATLMPMLVRNQKPDGHWECPGLNSRVGEFDPYFSTTLNTLSLEVCYRYLQSYKVQHLEARAPVDPFRED